MRIDKFLWSVRIYKTRSLASKACIAGKVKLNEKVIKPSKPVVTGNAISIKKGPVEFKYQIKTLLKNRVGAKLVEDYIENITPKVELDKLEMMKLRYNHHRAKGLGRPTKKDRREMDNLFPIDDDSEWDWDDWDEDEF
ncbi:MAG: RNA-binding S4 domain-containing protein [Bacteroidetes bacterium]|nr:MAG: RNA-binding S4 domain-containing protein [Bacteroidota bacterium]